MNRAINVLKNRIGSLNECIKDSQKVVDEPEMLCDYEFAMNDIANYELEILELQKAIQILLKVK